MPKPENPGQQGRDKAKGKKSKGVEKWTAKGYTAVVLAAGETEVEQVPLQDPATQSLQLAGQIFSASGKKLTGRQRPHLSVTEDATGAVITSSKPATEDVTILYKVVDDVGDDDDEDGEETPPVI